MNQHLLNVVMIGLLASTSCLGVVESEVTRIQSVCTSSGNGTDGMVTELTLNVDFAECLSSSCDMLKESSCAFTVEGNLIEVSGMATIESQGNACNDDCGSVTAQCTLEVPNGTYTIRTDEFEFEYEVGMPPECGGNI